MSEGLRADGADRAADRPTDRAALRKLSAGAARAAAEEVPGVVGVVDARMTPAGPRSARLHLAIVAEYGASLPEIAEEIRGRAAAAVESAAGLAVLSVDVTVADLYVPGEPLAVPGLAAPQSGTRLDF